MLPGVRADLILEWAVIAPRIAGHDKAERVIVELAHELSQLEIVSGDGTSGRDWQGVFATSLGRYQATAARLCR